MESIFVGAAVRVQLARAFAVAGQPAEAGHAYEDFFALPILKEAGREYAELR